MIPRDDAEHHASGYGPVMSETADSPEGSVAVLIGDDQALVRAGFRAILEEQPGIRVVGEAGDGRDGIDVVRRRRGPAGSCSRTSWPEQLIAC